jgi:hypothetical protein
MQINNVWQCPEETGIEMTLEEFLEKYKGKISTGLTTICEPPLKDFIAEIDENTNLWLSIPIDELNNEK